MIAIADASVFMNVFSLEKLTTVYNQILISDLCYNELKSSLSQGVLSLIEDKLMIVAPSTKNLKEAEITAKQMGEHSLSSADLSVIGLALDFVEDNPIVISDDFSVQNVAKKLGFLTKGFKTGKKVKTRHYFYFCKACGHNNGSNNVECDVCGFTGFQKRF